MHVGIVNGYQLLYNAHTMPKQHRGTRALLFYSLSSFSAFSYRPFSFLGASLVFVNRFSFVIPWQTTFCTHPRHQNDLLVHSYYLYYSLSFFLHFFYLFVTLKVLLIFWVALIVFLMRAAESFPVKPSKSWVILLEYKTFEYFHVYWYC